MFKANYYLFIFLILLSPSFSLCQQFKWHKPKYIAKIYDYSENYVIKGALYNINDSLLFITSSSGKVEFLKSFQIPVRSDKIDEIKIQRKFTYILSDIFIKSALVTGGVGTVFDMFLLSQNTDNTQQREFIKDLVLKSGFATVFSVIVFSVSGVITRNIHTRKITVSKNQKVFVENKNIIKNYCFVQ